MADWRKGATFSKDGTYRYHLWRALADDLAEAYYRGTGLFLLCNPSVANDQRDDPTTTKCCGFGRAWGLGRIEIVNPLGYIATYPKEVRKAYQEGEDIVGPENQAHIESAWAQATVVIVGWGGTWRGNFPQHPIEYLPESVRGKEAYCIGYTPTNGDPRHPLMPAYTTPLEPYNWRAS